MKRRVQKKQLPKNTAGTQNPLLSSFETNRSNDDSRKHLQVLDESSVASAIKHIAQYDNIIRIYSVNAEKSLCSNRIYKSVYFWGSGIILVVVAIFMCRFLCEPYLYDSPTDYIAPVVSFVTAYIVLPVTITKYLFNPQESHDLNEIVKSIQKHDRIMTGHDSSSSEPDNANN